MPDEADVAEDDADSYRVTPKDETESRLLRTYLGRRREELTYLNSAIADGRFDDIRRIGHNLAGSGAAYGLIRISSLGEQLERAAERRASDQVAATITELERFLGRISIRETRG